MSLLVLACVLAPAGGAQRLAHNGIEFSNWWLTAREDRFPNDASGNVAGDGLFKVLPAEILERSGDHRVTGYRVAISVHDGYRGSFPVTVRVPGVQLHRTVLRRIEGQVYETLDPTAPVGPRFDPIPVTLPKDDSWVVEVAFDPKAKDPKLRRALSVPAMPGGKRAGLAVLVLAPPGEKRTPATPAIVLQSSYQERHLPPGRPSYSGSYDARTKTVRMFGTRGQPSASGELYVALRFGDPTLQLRGSSAGGVGSDPQRFETLLGPGAYATDLATARRVGFFGLFAQAESFDPGGAAPTHTFYPLIVAAGPRGPDSSLRLGGVELRVDRSALGLSSLLIQVGLFGPLRTYRARGVAGFAQDQRGVYASPDVRVPPSPSLFGGVIWLQGLIVDRNLRPAGVTNVVRMTLR